MQATQRDPIPLWTHLYHWWDNMRMRMAPHPSPIRKGALLYNPFRTTVAHDQAAADLFLIPCEPEA